MEGGGKPEALNEKSKASHRRRKRNWPEAVVTQILIEENPKECKMW